jgi:hypothetical protein
VSTEGGNQEKETMKYHPYAELFPMMEEAQFEKLCDDIKENGLLDNIWSYEGKILDGRNRYEACKKTRTEQRFTEYRGKNPLGFVISRNLERRHLSTKERAEIAAKIANMREGKQKDTASNEAVTSQSAAAKALGVSRSSVQRAKSKMDSGKSKPSKPKKDKATSGWTTEDLKKDTELLDCFTAIAAVYGNEDTKSIRTGSVGLKRKDVLYLAKLPKAKMVEIQDLIFANHWKPEEAMRFVNVEPDDRYTVSQLKNLCLSTKGKYWTHDFSGFDISVKAKRAAQR